MRIKVARPWELPEREATPESAYWNRRDFLKTSGLFALSMIAGVAGAEINTANTELYPAKRNQKYILDRSITKEAVAAQHNNYYEFTDQKDVYRYIQKFKVRPWTIKISGKVKKPATYDIDQLTRLFSLEERLYRHRCVEAWAMAVPWTGFAFADLIRMVEPLSSVKYVRMISFLKLREAPGQVRLREQYRFPYYEALTIQEAMNELAFLVTGIYGHPLPVQHGAPLRLAAPWKYGYKSIKGIVEMEFVERRPGTFWSDAYPKEYDFVSNVNPAVPHPRWSQATERMIDTGERRPTQIYNGYRDLVQQLYQ